ncbi:hypothetical protein HDU88_000524 [Geranomyces variabilis]|nr:hypothetical protein HDU88_000524 [Geranomyces variabilis]
MRHIGPRPLFVALLPLLLVALLLNTLSQALPRLFTASPTFLSTPQQPAPPPDAATYLATHPPTRIGFWKQCTGSSPCTDLQLACGADAQPDITALQNTPLEDLAAQFAHKQTQLCPRVNAARVLMALSLFAGAIAVFAVALRLAGLGNGGAAIPGLFAVTAAGVMCLMHLAAVGLLASVKSILDSLAQLTRALHPATGTSTALNDVTTEYALSASFWLVVAATAVSCALLPLAIVLAVHPASRRASLLPYPPLSGSNNNNNPPRAAKATSTTTLPLASLPTPPRRSATHQLRHADSGTGLMDDANNHDRYYNYADNDSGEPLYRRAAGGGNGPTTAAGNNNDRPRHHSGSTTASPPMTVIGAPYGDDDGDSSEDDEYGIPSPPPMMARPGGGGGGGGAGARVSTTSSASGDHPAAANMPLNWRR